MSDQPAESGRLNIEVPLRRSDVDSLGHVNQSVYHECLAEVRVPILRRAGGGYRFVLRRVELDHLGEVLIDDGPVRVSVEVTAVGNSSVTLDHEIHTADGRLAAKGRSVMVGWDREKRGKRVLDEGEKRRLLA